MKNFYFGLLLVLSLFLFGCPTPHEVLVDEYPLSDSLAAIIPYKDGDTVVLANDSGLTLTFHVQKVRQWKKENYFYDGLMPPKEIKYIRYEYIETTLESYYPNIIIVMTLYPRRLYDTAGLLDIRFNYSYWLQFLYDTGFVETDVAHLADTMTVKGWLYKNVVYGKLDKADFDSTIVYFDSLYYNKTFGIIKLKMSDNEEFGLIR